MKKFVFGFISLLMIGATIGVFYFKNEYQKAYNAQLAHIDPINEEDIEFKGAKPVKGIVNVLLLGSDARPGDTGNSDTLMIGQYNNDQKKLKLVSVMRDTYVDIPGHGMSKINAAYSLGGPDLVRQTLKKNFGINLHYYAIVDFKSFSSVFDILAPDGIEVDIPYEMSYGIGMTLPAGKQILHGNDALGYARFRHDINSDFGRVQRQQEIISKVKDEALSTHTITNLPTILGTLDAYVATNLDMKTMLGIGTSLITQDFGEIETLRIPLEESYEDEYNEYGQQILAVDLAENRRALIQFLSNKPSIK
ncbi:transcriptional regulator [Lysinibacillus alkalisoli]|uniref:Regulatory protein MsrR n=1 Tax=Lysinibacillus alkalisoli TaxID=1911548 RepID=A0A917LIR3_9BACI|nr:LCP family protein [Lysinibacillus alkalisoli]GGG27815.1 transcriptional regulator [Lysinibacillus alkalisoli]